MLGGVCREMYYPSYIIDREGKEHPIVDRDSNNNTIKIISLNTSI